ncbi:MAG: hypothetical protein IJC07_00285 [Clostridia bacterium]|nr:hypothetical protein [Clostridia bacterium]
MKKSKKLLATVMCSAILATSVFGGCGKDKGGIVVPEGALENRPNYENETETFHTWAYGQVMNDNYMNNGNYYYFYDENGNKMCLQTPERTQWLVDAGFNEVYLGSVFGVGDKGYRGRTADGTPSFINSEVQEQMDEMHKHGLKIMAFGNDWFGITSRRGSLIDPVYYAENEVATRAAVTTNLETKYTIEFEEVYKDQIAAANEVTVEEAKAFVQERAYNAVIETLIVGQTFETEQEKQAFINNAIYVDATAETPELKEEIKTAIANKVDELVFDTTGETPVIKQALVNEIKDTDIAAIYDVIREKVNAKIAENIEAEVEYEIFSNPQGAWKTSDIKFKDQEQINRFAAHLLEGLIDHPAYIGITVVDEPRYYFFQACREMAIAFKSVDPDGVYMMNMFPMDSSEGVKNSFCEGGGKMQAHVAYQKYLDQWVEYFKYNDHMCKGDACTFEHKEENRLLDHYYYDDYPIYENGVRNTYIHCNELVADWATKNGVETTLVLQSYAGDGAHRLCQYEDTLWQANMGMAFGHKGFSYYTWWTTHNTNGNLPDETMYPIDRDGDRNAQWYNCQKVNMEMLWMGKALTNFTYQGMTYQRRVPLPSGIGYLANLDAEVSQMKYVDIGSYTVTGTKGGGGVVILTELYDKENDQYGYFVVNGTDPAFASEISVTLNVKNFSNVQIWQSETISNIGLVDGQVRIELGTGRGAFIMPY